MLVLPKKSEDGVPYLSYSQWKMWNEAKSFNLRIEGKLEYMLEYFFGEEFPDMGWAAFGNKVEDYVTVREGANLFDEKEREVMETVETLGVFQQECWIDLGEFRVRGFLDDMTEDGTWIRDYKTASENSSKKYYKDDYYQLDIYALWILQHFGTLPDKMEVCIIERKGNPFKGEDLVVGDNVWYVDRPVNPMRIQEVKESLISTAEEISSYYQTYLKLCR